MDLGRALQMVFRFLAGPLIRAGIDVAARRGKDEADMTPEERRQARDARDLAKRAQRLARLTRRIGR